MVIYKDLKDIKEKFDIIDSIVYGIKWDENMLDLLIILDYYEGKPTTGKTYVIRLKDCFEAKFKMTKWMKRTPAKERQGYIWSWYTTLYMQIEQKDILEVRIITGLDNVWLTAKCEEIWIEDDEILQSHSKSNHLAEN